jgi:hypothetical protein
MTNAITIAELRRELDLSLEGFGLAIGLASKGNVSLIERGGRCSVKVALAIEALSGGRIPAASLNTDVALIESVRAGLVDPLDHAVTDSPPPTPPSARIDGETTPQAARA